MVLAAKAEVLKNGWGVPRICSLDGNLKGGTMNGDEMRQILTTLTMTRIQRSLLKQNTKLDKVNAQLELVGRSDKKTNELLAAKEVIEATIKKSMLKEAKIREQVMPEERPAARVIIPAEIAPEPLEATPETIEVDGATWKIEKTVYKAYRLGKDGKPTKQVRYLDVT